MLRPPAELCHSWGEDTCNRFWDRLPGPCWCLSHRSLPPCHSLPAWQLWQGSGVWCLEVYTAWLTHMQIVCSWDKTFRISLLEIRFTHIFMLNFRINSDYIFNDEQDTNSVDSVWLTVEAALSCRAFTLIGLVVFSSSNWCHHAMPPNQNLMFLFSWFSKNKVKKVFRIFKPLSRTYIAGHDDRGCDGETDPGRDPHGVEGAGDPAASIRDSEIVNIIHSATQIGKP